MKLEQRTFLLISGPLILGALMVWSIWTIAPDDLFTVVVGLPGLPISVERSFENPDSVRWIWSALLLGVPVIYNIMRDYSKLLPKELLFHVYFDNDSLNEAVATFSEDDVTTLRLYDAWSEHSNKFIDHLNTILTEKGVADAHFAEHTVAQGELKMNIEREDGWQCYHLRSAKAEMRVENFRGSDPLFAYSEHVETRFDRMSVSIADIILRQTIFLRQTYFLWFAPTVAGKERIPYPITATTRVRFFPWVALGPSLYIVDASELEMECPPKTMTIPVGCARYTS